MGTLDMGDFEYANSLADVMDVGAPRRRRGGGRGGRGVQLPYHRLVPRVPGVPGPGLRLQPLGWPVFSFTATSGNVLTQITRPQRPFKGKRLVLDIARTGATSTGLITVTQLLVGTDNQFVASNPIGAAAFAANAFDVNLELAPATTAIDITLQLAIGLVPTAPDNVQVSGTLFGEAIGA